MENRVYKKISGFLAGFLMGTLVLSGCTDAIPEMSDEQQKMIGEFAAITLLKYDANNRSRLVERRFIRGLDDPSSEETEEISKEEPKEDPGVNTPDTPVINPTDDKSEPVYRDIAAFLELPQGVSITFTGIAFQDSYTPEGMNGGFFALDAAEGKTLAVLSFELSNGSGADQEINVLSKNPIFKVIFDNAGTKNVLTTLLDSDLSTFKETLAAGASERVVLLAEIEKEEAGSIGGVRLSAKYAGDSYTFTLIP